MTKPTSDQLAALRVRIAELMGEKDPMEEFTIYTLSAHGYEYRCERPTRIYENEHFPTEFISKEMRIKESIPDYTGSLDAIAEAEGVLTRSLEQGVAFVESLEAVVQPSTGFELHHAEAWQRAIALDRTLSPQPIC